MNKILIFFALVTLLFNSCSKINDKDNSAQGVNEDVSLKLTAYNTDYEVFAEAKPLVVGKASRVLSHFSHLPSFKAVETGSITIHLKIGNKIFSHQLKQPTRKGIYAFDITPEVAGKGSITYEITTDKGKSELVVDNISAFINEKDALLEAKTLLKTSPFAAVFTKEQSWKIEFATEYPIQQAFGQVIKTTALVLPAQGDEIIVSAKTNGFVVLSNSSLLEGKSISAGQNLFNITGKGMADNNLSIRYAEAMNNFEKARAEYERSKELAEEKIVSAKDLMAAKNQYENAKVIFDNLSANFSSIGQNISSPMSGFVKKVYVQNGQYVEAGQPVITISQNKSLILRAEVQQKYTAVLGNISNANIRTIQNNKTYTLDELNGKVIAYGRSMSENNYLVPVNLEIDNKGEFIPGSFVELYLKTITNQQSLTLPNEAIMEDQGNYFVYVQIYPELFEKREVSPGGTDGMRTEILKGITSSDRIITKGAALVKMTQATGALDAHSGHNH